MMMRTLRLASTAIATTLLLSACLFVPSKTKAPPVANDHQPQPADSFFAHLQTLCGKAFAGRIVIDEPAMSGDNPFGGKALIMHVRQCDRDRLAIPFHIGNDHSRT